jgi:glycosyltransferase involved in cell wall biosynthesis
VGAHVSVVIPCHNEEGLLPVVLANLAAWCRSRPGGVEVLLVENGSSDRTLEIAEAAERDRVTGASVRVLVLPVGDYGSAVRAGIKASVGSLVAVLDCDMVDPTFVDRSCVLLDEDDGLGGVLASKRAAGSSDERSLYRRLGTLVFSSLVRAITGSSLSDTHGNKVLRGTSAREHVDQVREDGSLFDTELLVRMERAGWSFTEMPTTIEESRPPRSSYLLRVPGTIRGLIRLRRRLCR